MKTPLLSLLLGASCTLTAMAPSGLPKPWGWDVDEATGALSLGIPLAEPAGEIPVQVALRLNAMAATVGHDQTRTYPVFGSIHFGYLTPSQEGGDFFRGTGCYVLEDGRTIMEADWQDGTRLRDGTFQLSAKFGFSSRTPSQIRITEDASLALFDASLEDLGPWAQQVPMPKGHGQAPSTFKILMDNRLARVFAYLEAYHSWAPVL